jgi:uncharacterized membrane protein
MRSFIFHYVVTLMVFLAIDFTWLSVMGPKFYAAELGGLLREKPNLGIAFLFYVIFVLGLLVFVIQPALGSPQIWHAIGLGALFGLVAYSTYDLTNLATVKGFTAKVAIVDMVWGAALSAAVTGISLWIFRILK